MYLKKKDPDNEPPTQIAIENSQPTLQNSQNQKPDEVVYETYLEHNLETKMDSKTFNIIHGNRQGDLLWNGITVSIVGGTSLESNEDEYIINPDLQKALIDTKRASSVLKDLNDTDKVTFLNILQSLTHTHYQPVRGEEKWGRYK